MAPPIIQPGSVPIEVKHHDFVTADPIVAQIRMGDHLQMVAFGGLTKVQYLAGQILANMALAGEPGDEQDAEMVDRAVQLAERLLLATSEAPVRLILKRTMEQIADLVEDDPKIDGATKLKVLNLLTLAKPLIPN